jgi:hypothetical protein
LTHITPAHLYPLTSPQREIWFDQMLHDGIPLYNIGGYVKIPGPINPVLFEQAVNLLVKKHETLRTMLTEVQDEDGIPMQMYTEQLTVTVPLHDFSTSSQPMKRRWHGCNNGLLNRLNSPGNRCFAMIY